MGGGGKVEVTDEPACHFTPMFHLSLLFDMRERERERERARERESHEVLQCLVSSHQ